MANLLSKILKTPFTVELILNGSFIFLYALKISNKIPISWNMDFVNSFLTISSNFVPLVLFFIVILNFIMSDGFSDFLRKHIFSLIVFIPIVITWGDQEFVFWLSSAHLLSSFLVLYDSPKKVPDKIKDFLTEDIIQKLRYKISPPQMIFITYAGLITVGTFLLKLPVSAADGVTISWIDSIFMITSAACVTGLTTIPVDTSLSLFGQSVIILVVQLGGLSIMTFYSAAAIMMGKSLGLKERTIMQDLLEVSSAEELMNVVVDIIRYTFVIELWGAIVLTFAFVLEGESFGRAFYYGVFHAISAFCNAGFSLFSTSIESYATKPLIHGTIIVLVLFGGFGFIVLKELVQVVYRRKSLIRMTLHAKTSMFVTILLLMSGTIFLLFSEYLHALDSYTLWEKIQIAVFQSAAARTAGFNSIPLTSFSSYTLFVLIILMFIGGNPGSTAGGVKTTTVAVLFRSLVSTFRGESQITIFDRKIPAATSVKATALIFMSLLVVCFFFLLMLKLEPEQSFLSIFFEVVSAFATVGMSLGITPYLSAAGKIVISILMFIGRIGPLTLILAIGHGNNSGQVNRPDGHVIIG